MLQYQHIFSKLFYAKSRVFTLCIRKLRFYLKNVPGLFKILFFNYSLFCRYVLPNQPCDNSTPLSSYLVPLDSIERAAGFLLFDKLPRNQLKLMK
jgi:hypothetical protein